ncbi:protein of unknown function [Latilactobacillus sakei]|nr:protein of unknown function [Latilactobacillus sakei]
MRVVYGFYPDLRVKLVLLINNEARLNCDQLSRRKTEAALLPKIRSVIPGN